MKEMAKEIQNSRSGEIKKTAEDLDEFMNKVSYLFMYVLNFLILPLLLSFFSLINFI